MKGSAPGRVSSVRPARAFGALATTEWGSDMLAEMVLIEVGEASHVHPVECIGREVTSRIAGP